MKHVHFFKAKSRIGLKNKPINQTQLNLGVEDGPDAVLTSNFLNGFKEHRVFEYIFPNPEDILSEDFDIVLVKHLEEFKNQINYQILRYAQNDKKKTQNDKNGQILKQAFEVVSPQAESVQDDKITQIVIGGDHSVTFSSLLAILERIDDTKDLGYIQFDSHGDMNLAKDSPTGNFHGMYLRPFLDEQFDIPEVKKLVNKQLKSKSMLFIGNLDLDPKEKDFFEKKKIKNITREKLKAQISNVKSYFKEFISKFKWIHVSFDIDGMDKSVAPATGIPADNGLFREDVLPFLEIISKHSNFSFDLCEVNPKKRGAERTIKLAQEILIKVIN